MDPVFYKNLLKMAVFYKYQYTNKRKNIHPWRSHLPIIVNNNITCCAKSIQPPEVPPKISVTLKFANASTTDTGQLRDIIAESTHPGLLVVAPICREEIEGTLGPGLVCPNRIKKGTLLRFF